MWAASAAAMACATRKLRDARDDRMVPLMGVMGAFLFAAQMINFTIPATGSSGHLGGGLLLAVLLGPYAALLTIASVLVVQALFFADGGILALGCNIFNMGVVPALIIYPFVYMKIIGRHPGEKRRTIAILISAILGLQIGPFCVVLETWLSGVASLPFTSFVLLMQPIHLVIGAIEGAVTAAVVSFLIKARPDIVLGATLGRPLGDPRPLRSALAAGIAVALFTGGVVSWYASHKPDGLEWALARMTADGTLKAPHHDDQQGLLARLQRSVAFLPDYTFRGEAASRGNAADGQHPRTESRWETSVAGVAGTVMALAVVWVGGHVLTRRQRRRLVRLKATRGGATGGAAV